MSRILDQKYEIVPIDQIKAHPQNARRGNTAGICESIAENGFFGAVYVQRSSGFILAGKHRWDSAKREGLNEIPVIWLEVDDPAARKIISADNALSDQATYDQHALAELLTEISGSEGGLLGSGFDQAGFDKLITELGDQALGVAEAHDQAEKESAAEPEAGAEETGEASPEPEAKTLLGGLLIAEPTWNKKRTMRFLSLRKWNSERKVAGIEAFKTAKRDRDSVMVDAAAMEIVTALREYGGNWRHWTIAAPPAGASAASGWHFATEMVRTIATQIEATFMPIFEERPRTGGSHPRSFDRRGEVTILGEVNGLNILLIDDIASSATTLEECRQALLNSGAATVLALSWIYEEAEERPEAA